VLILSRAEVRELLDLDDLVDAVAEAMADLSAGSASVPPRVAAFVDDVGGLLAAMPAYLPSKRALETKLVSLFPGNAGSALPTHQAVIVTFDPENGSPSSLMDATYITEVRTAAGSALSTRLLARTEAEVLAVIGTGVQARAHARAVPRVRPIREIRVAGRDPEKARAFASALAADLGIEVRPADSPDDAMEGADVVCACTHALDPVVRREWVAPGMHVTSVGLNRDGREVDGETVRDSLVVVESRQAVLAPFPAGANDLTWPIRDGLLTEDHIHAELGELVAGTRPGRTTPEQITLYKSVGVGAQDAAAAALVLQAARDQGAGVEVEL
jgi:ornithine cyclodeaminase/alanine dehydrogenase-like protein (mu-crystallin family)